LQAAGYGVAGVIGFVSARSDALEPITLDLDGAMAAREMALEAAG
jgi:hypothetical protein